MNVYSLLEDPIRRFPDRPAVTAGTRVASYAGFDAACGAVSDHFGALGCIRGDRVLLFLNNGFEFPILLMAAIRAGLVVVPVNAKLLPTEVAWICEHAGAKIVVADRSKIAALAEALPVGGAPKILAVEDIDLTGPASPAPPADVDPDDPAWLFYTSGTTGRPKGAVLTHRNLIASSVNCLADVMDFQPSDRVLHVAPLSHGSGIYLLPALARGAENRISERPRFDPDETFDLVAEAGITVIAFVAPTMIVRMLAAHERDDIPALRGIVYGGAPIHLDHIRAAVRRFGPVFRQLYGQGEVPMTISSLSGPDHLDDDDETLLSAGFVRTGMQVRILDGNDAPVLTGGEGEICVRGDVVMAGYWRDEAASREALRNGWLHTGDMGYFDAAGRLRLLDRRHDTIISGGTNIYPKEIEDVVATHPEVREAIAFGVPDREWGESVAVAVVIAAHGTLDEAGLVAFCSGRIARFKHPKHVLFLDALPQSAYGKVLRRELRSRFETTA